MFFNILQASALTAIFFKRYSLQFNCIICQKAGHIILEAQKIQQILEKSLFLSTPNPAMEGILCESCEDKKATLSCLEQIKQRLQIIGNCFIVMNEEIQNLSMIHPNKLPFLSDFFAFEKNLILNPLELKMSENNMFHQINDLLRLEVEKNEQRVFEFGGKVVKIEINNKIRRSMRNTRVLTIK